MLESVVTRQDGHPNKAHLAVMWNLERRARGAGRGQKATWGSSQRSRRERMVVWARTVAMGGNRRARCKAWLLCWRRCAGGAL